MGLRIGDILNKTSINVIAGRSVAEAMLEKTISCDHCDGPAEHDDSYKNQWGDTYIICKSCREGE